MTTMEQQTLRLLTELLVQIRGIAGDAAATGHASAMGRGHFSPESACKAIYQLADAAHNVPGLLSDGGPASRLEEAVEATVCASAKVFGGRSTLRSFGASTTAKE